MAANEDPFPYEQIGLNLPADKQDLQPALKVVRDCLRYLWDRIRFLNQQVKGPQQGTLNPDEKPNTLTTRDVGFGFFATDFNRLYRWTGTGWIDDPTAPSRFQITHFPESQLPEPSTGWARCDGAGVLRSTSIGGAVFFTTPIIPALNGQPAWIRL